MAVRTIIEPRRGCGYRVKGGSYLIGSGSSIACCKLNFPLTVCSCCGNTVKFSRGLQKINSTLFCSGSCSLGSFTRRNCPIAEPGLDMGLMWVGEQHYPSTRDFVREATAIGVSKRIGVIPKWFRVGMWVALAHRRAIGGGLNTEGTQVSAPVAPGVFYLFKVNEMQYVVKGDESPEQLAEIEAKGFDLVNVIPEGSQTDLDLSTHEDD